jgi:Lrp/AsnC family transcriptional regulator, regulator for asnA, asnC and gidA
MIRQGQGPFGTITLDDLDRRIIKLLRHNARRSYADIARAVGVSEPTIRNRVDRMLRTGAILPHTRVNPVVLGFPVDAMVGIRVDRGCAGEVGAKLAKMEHVSYVAYTTGGFDLLVEAHLPDNEGLYRFLNEDLPTVEGVNHTETWHILRTEKLNDEWEGENIERPLPQEGGTPSVVRRRPRGAALGQDAAAGTLRGTE